MERVEVCRMMMIKSVRQVEMVDSVDGADLWGSCVSNNFYLSLL